jgi:hypothetical protein
MIRMAKGVEYLIKNRASLDLKGRLATVSVQISNGAIMTAPSNIWPES